MTRRLTTLLAAAVAALFASTSFASDFMQSARGEAALQTPQSAADCSRAAQGDLARSRAALEKRCAEDGGLFNAGLVNAELHSRSCTADQIVTCTDTESSKEAAVAQYDRPEARPDDPPPKSKSKKDPKTTHLKKPRPAPTDDLAPKQQRPHRKKKPQFDPSPSTEVREVSVP